MFRIITVRALWAMADVLEIVRDGLIFGAAKVSGRTELVERVESYTS